MHVHLFISLRVKDSDIEHPRRGSLLKGLLVIILIARFIVYCISLSVDYLLFILDCVEMPSGQDTTSYYAPGNERAGNSVARDTDSVNASYERYLRTLVFLHIFFLSFPKFWS